MDYEAIKVEVADERIGVVTLSRPEKRNALSTKMRNEITGCLEEWLGSEEIGVVIFTGEAPAFSAGFDIKEFNRPELAEELFRSSSLYHRAVWRFPRPTIAAVNGPAFGGGLDLATLCDIRICGPAAAFGHPEIKFGAPPLYTPLRWIVGCGLARDLCLTGRTVDAEEALRMGLVSEVVSQGDVLERALSIARSVLEAPAATLETTKRYMIENSGKGFEESFTAEHDVPFEGFIRRGGL